MALDITVDQFFELVGHDGSEIVYPDLEGPMRRRGIHVQEAIEAAWKLGFTATPFELFPQGVSVPGGIPALVIFPPYPDGNWDRFTHHLSVGRGVIECQGRRCGHAVAFESGVIYDPDALVPYPYSRQSMEERGLFTQRLWRVRRK